MANKILIHNLSESIGSVTSADIFIDPGDGNLTVDGAVTSVQDLATGTLEYSEKSGLPTWSLSEINRQTTFSIKSNKKGQSWLRVPWAACNGATEWHVHLNRNVPTGITAHSDGGNIALDLEGMPVTHVSAYTGGGNVEVILPDLAAALSVTARSGAGNVVIQVPGGIAARIRATTGLGKLILSPRFVKIENDCYQSPDYDQVDRKIEMTISSGAGNVIVEERITS